MSQISFDGQSLFSFGNCIFALATLVPVVFGLIDWVYNNLHRISNKAAPTMYKFFQSITKNHGWFKGGCFLSTKESKPTVPTLESYSGEILQVRTACNSPTAFQHSWTLWSLQELLCQLCQICSTSFFSTGELLSLLPCLTRVCPGFWIFGSEKHVFLSIVFFRAGSFRFCGFFRFWPRFALPMGVCLLAWGAVPGNWFWAPDPRPLAPLPPLLSPASPSLWKVDCNCHGLMPCISTLTWCTGSKPQPPRLKPLCTPAPAIPFCPIGNAWVKPRLSPWCNTEFPPEVGDAGTGTDCALLTQCPVAPQKVCCNPWPPCCCCCCLVRYSIQGSGGTFPCPIPAQALEDPDISHPRIPSWVPAPVYSGNPAIPASCIPGLGYAAVPVAVVHLGYL